MLYKRGCEIIDSELVDKKELSIAKLAGFKPFDPVAAEKAAAEARKNNPITKRIQKNANDRIKAKELEANKSTNAAVVAMATAARAAVEAAEAAAKAEEAASEAEAKAAAAKK